MVEAPPPATSQAVSVSAHANDPAELALMSVLPWPGAAPALGIHAVCHRRRWPPAARSNDFPRLRTRDLGEATPARAPAVTRQTPLGTGLDVFFRAHLPGAIFRRYPMEVFASFPVAEKLPAEPS